VDNEKDLALGIARGKGSGYEVELSYDVLEKKIVICILRLVQDVRARMHVVEI
jgi:hypothetical protein